jgi:hypothetical protein
MEDELVSYEQKPVSNTLTNTNGINASEMIEKLLGNEHVPEELLTELWVLFGKSTKLSFLGESDVKILLWEYDLLEINIIESIPKSEYNERLESKLHQIKIEFFLNLRRSQGSGRLNERELMGASTQAVFSERPLSKNGGSSNEKGFFDRIYGVFRGGNK